MLLCWLVTAPPCVMLVELSWFVCLCTGAVLLRCVCHQWRWQAASPLATAHHPSLSGTHTPPPPLLLPHLPASVPPPSPHPLRQQAGAHQLLLYSHGWCGRVCAAGTLPPSWGALTKLRVCYLFTNNLRGPLPGSWSGMAALEDLQLSRNSLTGGSTGRWWSMAGGLYMEQVILTLGAKQWPLLGQQLLAGKTKGQSIHAGVAGRRCPHNCWQRPKQYQWWGCVSPLNQCQAASLPAVARMRQVQTLSSKRPGCAAACVVGHGRCHPSWHEVRHCACYGWFTAGVKVCAGVQLAAPGGGLPTTYGAELLPVLLVTTAPAHMLPHSSTTLQAPCRPPGAP
jgi:hypothetical protein